MTHPTRHTTPAATDEEGLAAGVTPAQRRREGVYFSPAWLVDEVLTRVGAHLPAQGALAVVDPACGAGAFLAAASARWPRARVLGLELDPDHAQRCAQRLPDARIAVGNALVGDALERLLACAPDGAFELWVGNPPYNGRSPLLDDPSAYQKVRALLPAHHALPRGTSLRDDYAFFLLRAAQRLGARRGALAFVTSASLLDAFLYAPVRRALGERLRLREVLELPPGTFRGTKVRTCVTVWTSPEPTGATVKFSSAGAAQHFVPGGADFRFRPLRAEAAALDARWSEAGEALTALVPIHLPGLKTRFDELLADDDPRRLLERVDAFLRCPPHALPEFARAHGLDAGLLPKLSALRATVPLGLTASRDRVRPLLRYRGRRGFGPPAFCYLERALIPRGDHRLRGGYDAHATFPKLVFNVRELPLHAAVAEGPGCVTAYQHARFAPLEVPRCALSGGLAAAAAHPSDARVPNLSPRGLAWATALGGPLQAFRAIAEFVNSAPVQSVWAPEYGTRQVLPVPLQT